MTDDRDSGRDANYIEPFDPPLTFGDLEPVDGDLGLDPEDFCVDERPAYEPSGEGPHYYVQVRKRSLTTRELIAIVARCAGVKDRDIGSAGMKDKHAITSQWLSVPEAGAPPDTWQLPDGVTLLQSSRHQNKLRTGHLTGNRFTLRLNTTAPNAEQRAQRIFDAIANQGLPNYFGRQRFGRGGKNLSNAVAWARGKRRRVKPFQAKLFASVLQSEVFNRYAAKRHVDGIDQVFEGEVVRLTGSSRVFVVEDAETDSARLREGDIVLTGPMRGPKMKQPQARGADLENAAAADVPIDAEDWGRIERWGPGTRRDLLLELRDASIARDGDQLVIGFELPPGAYATNVLRELTHRDPEARDPRRSATS